MPNPDEQLVARALLAVHELAAQTNAAIAPVLERHRLTEVTAHLLWLLDPQRESSSMTALAERMHCSASNVTFLSRQLEDRGLAHRVRSARDLRQRDLLLTERGIAARQELVDRIVRDSPWARLDDRDLRSLATVVSGAMAGDVGEAAADGTV